MKKRLESNYDKGLKKKGIRARREWGKRWAEKGKEMMNLEHVRRRKST